MIGRAVGCKGEGTYGVRAFHKQMAHASSSEGAIKTEWSFRRLACIVEPTVRTGVPEWVCETPEAPSIHAMTTSSKVLRTRCDWRKETGMAPFIRSPTIRDTLPACQMRGWWCLVERWHVCYPAPTL